MKLRKRLNNLFKVTQLGKKGELRIYFYTKLCHFFHYIIVSDT